MSNFKERQKQAFEVKFNKIKQKNINKINNLIKNKKSSLKTRESWIKNISGIHIPKDILQFLSLGPKFGVAFNNNEIPTKIMLAGFESHWITFSIEKKYKTSKIH